MMAENDFLGEKLYSCNKKTCNVWIRVGIPYVFFKTV